MARHRNWIGSHNTFLNRTRGSFVLSYSIFFHHSAALLSATDDPYIMNLYNMFNRLQEDFSAKYASYNAVLNAKKAANHALRALLGELSSVKIQEWDIAIQMVHRRGTQEYEALLPHYRKPFQKGKYDFRIHQINTFALALEGKPALAAVQADVEATGIQLKQARRKRWAYPLKLKYSNA